MFTGVRRAEICGLEWKDVDFKQGLLHIRRNSLYLPEKGIFEGKTKTKSSVCTIKISDEVVNILRQHKIRQAEERLRVGDQWNNSDRVLTRWDGMPIHPSTITKQVKRFAEKSGFPGISPKSLRHTHATLLIANGINILTVAGRPGHSEVSTTTDIYAHAIRSADEAAAEALDQALLIKNKA